LEKRKVHQSLPLPKTSRQKELSFITVKKGIEGKEGKKQSQSQLRKETAQTKGDREGCEATTGRIS